MSRLVFLYVLQGGGYLKVGITRDLTRRLASMNGGAVPFEVSLVGAAVVHEDVAIRAEADVLAHLGRRARGEWIHEDRITVADIVGVFAMCSALLPSRYRYTFMPGATASLSDRVRSLAQAARSDARARAARDVFEVAAMEIKSGGTEPEWQVLGKLALPSRPEKRERHGPPTFRQWKKALQNKTLQDIAERRAKMAAAE